MPVVHIAIEAVQTALDRVNLAQTALIEYRLHGAEIGVQSALVVNGELHAAFLGDCDHAVQLLGGHGNRLFTDDILTGLGCLYHQIIMLVVVGCDQHNVNFRVVHQLVVGRIALDALLHVFQLLGINVRDTNHADSVHLGQHFFMLVAHKAVAYDTDSDIIHKKHLFPSNHVISQIFCAQQH